MQMVITFLVVCLGAFDIALSSDVEDNISNMVINVDGQVVKVARRDTRRFRFDPEEAMNDREMYVVDTENDTDYSHLLRRLKRDSDVDDDDAKRITCMENLRKFRMLSKNRPLQFVVIVEEGGEARLTCHFCEDNDKVTESREWDEREAAEGRPLWRDDESIRSPILWYRIRHSGERGRGFRMHEVKVNLHDDEVENRIYVTSGHTLVVDKAEPEDAGTYFCRDTRTKADRFIKDVIMDWEVKEMMGHQGAFRFLIHLDVLKKNDIPVVERSSERQSHGARIEENNVEIFFNWEQWSSCSMCDQPGEKRKRGLCTVKKLYEDRESWPWYVDAVLTAQASGVPCRSSLFHTEHASMTELRWFKPDEIVRRGCRMPCKRKGFFKRLLSKKTLSPAGLSSMMFKEKKEKKKPKTINATEGETIQLKCPGGTLDDVVMWVNNSRYMPGVTLANVTEGRVSVDINGTLHISPLLSWDRGLYLCAVGDKEMGHVFLNVTVIAEDEFARYGMWVVCSLPADFAVFLLLMIVKHIHRKRILISSQEAGSSGSEESEENNSNINTNASTTTRTVSCNSNSSICSSSGDDESSSSETCRSGSSKNRRSSSSRSVWSSSYGYPSQTNI